MGTLSLLTDWILPDLIGVTSWMLGSGVGSSISRVESSASSSPFTRGFFALPPPIPPGVLVLQIHDIKFHWFTIISNSQSVRVIIKLATSCVCHFQWPLGKGSACACVFCFFLDPHRKPILLLSSWTNNKIMNYSWAISFLIYPETSYAADNTPY